MWGAAAMFVKRTDGPISRYINRRISTRITSLIIRYSIPLTPNQVSVLSLVIALAGAYFIAQNPIWLGGILVQVSSIIDGVDGELARARRMASPRGGFLDAMLDRYADTAIIIGLALAVLRYSTTPLTLIWVMLALSGDLLVSYLHARGEASLGKHPIFIGVIPQLASRDVRLFIVFLGCLVGRPMETIVIIAILSHAYVIAKTLDVFLHTPD